MFYIFTLFIFAMSATAFSQISTEELVRQGIQHYLNGDPERAYQIFLEMENAPPADKKFFIYYALTLKDLNYSNYGEWIEKGLQIFPGDPELTLMKVEWLSEQLKFQTALELLKPLKDALPKKRYNQMMAYLSYNQGVILYQKGMKKESARWFLQASKWLPEEPRFIRNYAIVLYETEEKQQALKILEKYIRKYPTDQEMTKLLIQLYSENQDVKKLGKLLEQNARINKTVEDSLVLAHFYLSTGKLNKALPIFHHLEQSHPQDRRPSEIQLDFWERQLQRTKMDSILSEMEKKFPGDTTVWQMQFKNYMEMDSLRKANQVLKKMLKQDSLNITWHLLLLQNLKKTNLAEWEDYLEKITSYPFSPEQMGKIAHLWFEAGKYNKAKMIIKDLLFIGYETPLILTDLGIIYYREQNTDSARIVLKKAIEFNKNKDYRSYFYLADLFLTVKDSVSARLYFEIGMEVLLQQLGAVQQELTGKLGQKNAMLQERYRIQTMAEENERIEKDLHHQVEWFSNHYPKKDVEEFLHQFLARFPRNKYLRYMLADFYLSQNKFDKAKSLLRDVLYMDPSHIPARRKLIEIALHEENNISDSFSLYREIFRNQPDSLNEKDYRIMIDLARKLKMENMLAQEWLLTFDQGYRDTTFVRHLTELLHYAGFHEKAREVQKVAKKKKQWVRLNPLLEYISPSNTTGSIP